MNIPTYNTRSDIACIERKQLKQFSNYQYNAIDIKIFLYLLTVSIYLHFIGCRQPKLKVFMSFVVAGDVI